MLFCTWNLVGFWGSTWAHSQVLPGVVKFLRVDVACRKLVTSSSPGQCPQPITFHPPWQLVPRPQRCPLVCHMPNFCLFWGVLPTHWQQGLASFSVLHPLSSTLSIRSWAEVPFCIFPNLSLENTQYSAVLLSHLIISVLIGVNLVTDLCNCFYIELFFLFYFTLNFKIILYVLSLPLLSPGERFLLHRYIFHCNSYSWG